MNKEAKWLIRNMRRRMLHRYGDGWFSAEHSFYGWRLSWKRATAGRTDVMVIASARDFDAALLAFDAMTRRR